MKDISVKIKEIKNQIDNIRSSKFRDYVEYNDGIFNISDLIALNILFVEQGIITCSKVAESYNDFLALHDVQFRESRQLQISTLHDLNDELGKYIQLQKLQSK